MRAVEFLGAMAALIVSVFVGRIVLHGLTDHGHLDVFHLVVAAAAAIAGFLLLYRAIRGSPRAA